MPWSTSLVDLIGGGFDAALRIAALPDSSLVARRLRPMRRFIVASPTYISRYGLPQHPGDLNAHHCLGYAYRARADVWRFRNAKGDEASVVTTGPLRVTNMTRCCRRFCRVKVLRNCRPSRRNYLADQRLIPLLADWELPAGGLYFVTPTAKVRPAKVEAISNFFAALAVSEGTPAGCCHGA